jgi:hypothetical protein
LPIFDALKQLAQLSGYIFYVDVDKDLHFEMAENVSSGVTLDNTNLQPVGAINMSSINTKDIILNLTDINPSGGYNYPSGIAYNYTIFNI